MLCFQQDVLEQQLHLDTPPPPPPPFFSRPHPPGTNIYLCNYDCLKNIALERIVIYSWLLRRLSFPSDTTGGGGGGGGNKKQTNWNKNDC